MNAIEKFEAAIDKLESQRESAYGESWLAWHPANGVASYGCNSSVDAATHDPDNPAIVVEGGADAVELIVTLHCTISPQLAILRDALSMFRDPIPMFAGYEERILAAQVALAESILGES